MARYKILVAAILLAAQAANAQQPPGNARDPGIRNDGLAGAGGPLPKLPEPLMQSFTSGPGFEPELPESESLPRAHAERCLGSPLLSDDHDRASLNGAVRGGAIVGHGAAALCGCVAV
jgi:hypothetical protein